MTKDDLAEYQVLTVKSIGWVIRETDREIVLSPNLADNESAAQVSVIPKVAITARQALKVDAILC